MEIHLPQSEAEYAFIAHESNELGQYTYPILTKQHVRGCSDHLSDKCWEGNVNGHHMEVILGSCYQARYHWNLPPEERFYLTSSRKLDVVSLRSLEVSLGSANNAIVSIGIGKPPPIPKTPSTRVEEFYKTMVTMGLNGNRTQRILDEIRTGVLMTTALDTGLFDDELTDAINDSLSEQDEEDLDVEDEEDEELLTPLPSLTTDTHSEFVPSGSTGTEPNSAVSLAQPLRKVGVKELRDLHEVLNRSSVWSGKGSANDGGAESGQEWPDRTSVNTSLKPGEHQAFDALSERVLDRSRRAATLIHLVDPKGRTRLHKKMSNGEPD